jgi:hypothetical protein
MESFFYLLMFFLYGELPWLEGTAVTNRADRINYQETRAIKTKTPRELLWGTIPGMILKN